jgi:Membrane bound O-acyl transferase family
LELLIAFIVVLSIPLWGYLILKNTKVNPSAIGWVITITFIPVIYFYIKTDPLLLMLLYIMSTFLSLKIVVADNHLDKENQLNFVQWLLFCYTWFGMNPLPFKSFPAKSLSDYRYSLKKGISRIIIGMILITVMNFIFAHISDGRFDFILQLSYLISLSLILHFGVLNISTGFLRWLGIPVTSLFKDPLKSRSLQEFWSKRWNIAFVELTIIAVLRPLKKRFGHKVAFWSSYIFSGLLHELAISLPVNSGYGKPFAYFMIQVFLIMTIEKYIINKMSDNLIKTCWVLSCLFLPIFLLFHKEFILQIILPLIHYLNIIS